LFLGDEDRRTNKIDCCLWIALVIFVSLLDISFFIVVFLRGPQFFWYNQDICVLSELLDGHFLGNSCLIGVIYFVVMLCLC